MIRSRAVISLGLCTEQLGEAQLMTVGVFDVEISLAPRAISWRLWIQPLAAQRVIERIGIVDAKDHAPPPTTSVCRGENEGQKRVPETVAGKGGLVAAIEHTEA